MNKLSRVGIDLAKNVFQLHGVDRHEKAVWRRRLKRDNWLTFNDLIFLCVLCGKDLTGWCTLRLIHGYCYSGSASPTVLYPPST